VLVVDPPAMPSPVAVVWPPTYLLPRVFPRSQSAGDARQPWAGGHRAGAGGTRLCAHAQRRVRRSAILMGTCAIDHRLAVARRWSSRPYSRNGCAGICDRWIRSRSGRRLAS